MFEVATQYNAIFRAQTNTPEGSMSLLSMWTSRRIQSFLKMLSSHLNRMEDSASLRDALEASVFFSSSMGRLGADFTAQLPTLFEPKMHALVVQAWKEGAHQLAETLKVCRDAGVAAPLTSNNVPNAASMAQTAEGQPMPPPRTLMALPPLARVVNAVLTGLNELRRCLLPGIFNQLRSSLNELLGNIKNTLHENEKAVNAPGLRGDRNELREAASRLRTTFTSIVDPFLRGSLEMAIGNMTAAETHYDKLRQLEREKEAAEAAKIAAANAAAAEEAAAQQAAEEAAMATATGQVESDAANAGGETQGGMEGGTAEQNIQQTESDDFPGFDDDMKAD